MKFCANLAFMFTEASSIVERYALAKEAGFKAVETGFPIGYTVDEVRSAKEAAGLEQVLINLKTGDTSKGELGVTAEAGKEDEFLTNLRVTIDYAKAVKASKIHIMAGKVESPTPKHWETYEKNLQSAAELLQNENILGLIEPINRHSIPNYFLSDYNKAVEIIKRIGSPHLKLMLDVFHLQHIGGDLSHNISALMPYVGHIQIAQVPSRTEPDSPGEVDYRYVLGHIAAAGYGGWVGLEYRPRAATTDGLGWIKEYGYSL